jgi:hypothetical protein
MGLLKRKKIPEELPDLAVNILENKKKKEVKPISEKREELKPDYIAEQEEERISHGEIKEKMEKLETENLKIEDEKAFFSKILQDINTELNEGKNIEDWYKNEFLPKDIVTEMKNYWGGQKKDLYLQSLGKSFKEKIEKKIENLKKMESEWQNLYFQLIKKEEEMKKEESELKKTISEFVERCKKREESDDE